MQFKFWVRHAKYDQPDTSDFAGQSFTVQIHNPKGEKIFEKTHHRRRLRRPGRRVRRCPRAPCWAVYSSSVVNHGGGSFRVEEYKKPEFEVKVDAPKEPVQLGEKIDATIKAKYYFGAPVTQGQGQVQGAAHQPQQRTGIRAARWDWFYGRGYWWFAADYAWYPGWDEWGCKRPMPSWWGAGSQEQPEVVLENEVTIGPDGTVKVADRHGAGQGAARRPGPQVHHHGRSGGRVAAHHRRHGQRAGGPQAVQGLRLGRSRPLPRRRRHRGQLHGPDARPEAGRRARAN